MLQKQRGAKDTAFRHSGMCMDVAQPEGKDGGSQQIEDTSAQREPVVRRTTAHGWNMVQYGVAVNRRDARGW